MVLFLVRFGIPLYDVLSLDMRSFSSLFVSAYEIVNEEKTEAAWTALYAATGESKDMKDWVKRWSKKQDETPDLQTQKKFISSIGKSS